MRKINTLRHSKGPLDFFLKNSTHYIASKRIIEGRMLDTISFFV
jgi:hypothetical protein